MRRQIVGYMPATLVTAVISVITVVVFSRLLSPQEFGLYSLGFSVVLFVYGAVFIGIMMAILRFYPAALRDGTTASFMRTVWTCSGVIALAVIAVMAIGLLVLPLDMPTRGILWLAIPVMLLRAIVALNQGQNRTRNAVQSFVLVECLHAIVGLGAGMALVAFDAPTGFNAMLGLLIGAAFCVLIGSSDTIVQFRRGQFDHALMRSLRDFTVPLAGSLVLTSLLQYADRFIVDLLAGPGALGLYSVAFSLVERPTSVICSLITTATFPMAVKMMEHEGFDAAQRQTNQNGIALLSMTVPACAGLAFTAPHIAAVLVGPEFRAAVVDLIPSLALVALIRNVATHYLDHNFHLMRRSDLLLKIYTPVAAVNIALDLLLIPAMGLFGAVVAALVALIGAVVADVYISSSVFGFRIPTVAIAKVLAASIPMIVVLRLVHTPLSIVGLIAIIAAGGVTYVAAAIALDLGGARTLIAARLGGRQRVTP